MYPQRFTDNNLPTNTTAPVIFSWDELADGPFQDPSDSTFSPPSDSTFSPPNKFTCPSFPKASASSYIKYYAPLEGHIILPLHYRISTYTLEDLSDLIETFLRNIPGLVIFSSGSSWSCSSLSVSSYTLFKICIYTSRSKAGEYIVETHCTEGDKWKTGDIHYQIGILLTTKNTSPMLLFDNNTRESESPSLTTSDYCNIHDMFNSPDLDILHEGILSAVELCTYKKAHKVLYDTNIIYELIKVIISNEIELESWLKQHVLLALTYLCKNKTDSEYMKNYLTETEQFTDFVETLKTITNQIAYTHLLNHAVTNATFILDNIA